MGGMNLFTSLGVNMEFNQNTGLNKEEFNYFKNEIYLRKKYSNLFPYAKAVFDSAIDLSPENFEEILGRISRTSARFSNNVHSGLAASTERDFHDSKDRLKFYHSVLVGGRELDVLSNRKKNIYEVLEKIKSDGKDNIKYFLQLDDEVNLDKSFAYNKISPELKLLFKDSKDNIGTNYGYDFIHVRFDLPQEFYNDYANAVLKESYIHEILHSMAFCEMGALFPTKTVVDYGKSKMIPLISAEEFGYYDKIYSKRGAEVFNIYDVVFDENFNSKLKIKKVDILNMLKEEAVVENWANDIAESVGVFDKLKENDIIYQQDYGTLPYIAGMFNIVCNNEWRNQHITGVKGEKCDLKDAERMDSLFRKYYLSYGKSRYSVDLSLNKEGIDKVVKSMSDIVQFCDKKYKTLLEDDKLSDKQIEKYKYNRYMFINMDSTSKFIDSQSVKLENSEMIYNLRDGIYKEFKMEKYSNSEQEVQTF